MKLKRLASTLVLVSAGTLVSVACGSSKNNPGTKTTCSPGDTRTCVGPGACKGGERCGSNGSWGVCDCGGGGSGGSAGSGGSGTGGSGGGTHKDGGVGGGAGDASTGDGKSDAQVIQKDPCPPANEMVLDCSHECVTGQCPDDTGCQSSQYVDVQSLPAYVRTPDHPGASPLCTCGDGGCVCDVSYGFPLSIGIFGVATLRVSVGPPWRLRFFNPFVSNWCDYALGTACTMGPGNHLYVMTNDPNAPARNVLIEDGAGKSCP